MIRFATHIADLTLSKKKEKNTHCKQDLSSTRVRTSKAAEPVSRKKMSRRFLIIKRTRTKKRKISFFSVSCKNETRKNSPVSLPLQLTELPLLPHTRPLCLHNQLLSASTLCSLVSCSATSKTNGDGMRPLQAQCDCVGNAREYGVDWRIAKRQEVKKVAQQTTAACKQRKS